MYRQTVVTNDMGMRVQPDADNVSTSSPSSSVCSAQLTDSGLPLIATELRHEDTQGWRACLSSRYIQKLSMTLECGPFRSFQVFVVSGRMVAVGSNSSVVLRCSFLRGLCSLYELGTIRVGIWIPRLLFVGPRRLDTRIGWVDGGRSSSPALYALCSAAYTVLLSSYL